MVPELPEVETIRRGLAPRLVGRRIEGVDWRPLKRLRSASPVPLERLEGRTVGGLRRHGKFLLIGFTDGSTLVVHLGMTGKLLFAEPGETERPHTHLVLALDDERQVRFSDPRRFGTLRLYGPDEPVRDVLHYGLDALGRGFTLAYLQAGLSRSRAPLKAFLMDQTKVAGVGNIYACEALWRAGLSPRLAARRTPARKVAALHQAVRGVLRDAIGRGGTSFNDYVDAIGQQGKFVAELAVFQREGEPCPRCGKLVRRIVQSGRSTFFCPHCQR